MDARKNRLLTGVSLLAVTLLFIIHVASRQIPDTDLWGRLSIAALYFKTGIFPLTDPFSFTFHGKPWIDHEWLSGFVFYGLLTTVGEHGFMLFKYGMAAATFALLFWLHRRVYQSSHAWAFFSLLITGSIIAFGYYASIRCQVFTFFFFTLFIAILEAVRLGRLSHRWLDALIPCGIIWANLHGGFALGLILLVIYSMGVAIESRTIKAAYPYLITLIILLAGISLLNPYGLTYWQFMAQALTLKRDHIGEWKPLPLFSQQYLDAQLLLLASFVIFLTGYFKSRDRHFLTTPLLVIAFTVAIVISAVRMQTFLPFVATAYLPLFRFGFPLSPLAKYRPVAEVVTPWLSFGFAAAMVFYLHNSINLLAASLPDENHLLSGFRYPVGAVRYLKQNGYTGNLMTPFPQGEFIYWNLYPAMKVSIDGRLEEVYSMAHFHDQYRFYKRDWPESPAYADKLKADAVLTGQQFPNVQYFDENPGWVRVYSDFSYMIYIRKNKIRPGQPLLPPPTETSSIRDFITTDDLERFATPLK